MAVPDNGLQLYFTLCAVRLTMTVTAELLVLLLLIPLLHLAYITTTCLLAGSSRPFHTRYKSHKSYIVLKLTRLSLSMACVLTFRSLNQYCIVLYCPSTEIKYANLRSFLQGVIGRMSVHIAHLPTLWHRGGDS